MAITVNSPGMGSRRFGSGDKQADFVRQHTQGRAAAWKGAPQGMKSWVGRCTSQWDWGVREGSYDKCMEKLERSDLEVPFLSFFSFSLALLLCCSLCLCSSLYSSPPGENNGKKKDEKITKNTNMLLLLTVPV